MLGPPGVVLQRAAESRGTEPPGPAEDVSATQCKQGARVLVIEGPDQLGLLKRRCPRRKASRLTGSLSPDGLLPRRGAGHLAQAPIIGRDSGCCDHPATCSCVPGHITP